MTLVLVGCVEVDLDVSVATISIDQNAGEREAFHICGYLVSDTWCHGFETIPPKR